MIFLADLSNRINACSDAVVNVTLVVRRVVTGLDQDAILRKGCCIEEAEQK